MAITIPNVYRARGGAGAFNSATTSTVGPIAFKRTTECLTTADGLACESRIRFSLGRSIDVKEKVNCVPISRASMSVTFGAYTGSTVEADDMLFLFNALRNETATTDGVIYAGLTAGATALLAGNTPQVDRATP